MVCRCLLGMRSSSDLEREQKPSWEKDSTTDALSNALNPCSLAMHEMFGTSFVVTSWRHEAKLDGVARSGHDLSVSGL